MIAVLKPGTSVRQRDNLISWFKSQGLDVHISEGQTHTVLGIIGDTTRVDIDLLQSLDIVDSAKRVSETYKLANRKFHPQDTVVSVSEYQIGGGHFQIIAVIIFVSVLSLDSSPSRKERQLIHLHCRRTAIFSHQLWRVIRKTVQQTERFYIIFPRISVIQRTLTA